jgi:hypothetical protein
VQVNGGRCTDIGTGLSWPFALISMKSSPSRETLGQAARGRHEHSLPTTRGSLEEVLACRLSPDADNE